MRVPTRIRTLSQAATQAETDTPTPSGTTDRSTSTFIAIDGGDEAARLRALLEPHGRDAYGVAEFGIGTNDRAIVTGVILEDEKVMGTIHIAFGDNKSMGGSVRVASHLDGLVIRPSVWFDDRPIMRDGRLLDPALG